MPEPGTDGGDKTLLAGQQGAEGFMRKRVEARTARIAAGAGAAFRRARAGGKTPRRLHADAGGLRDTLRGGPAARFAP